MTESEKRRQMGDLLLDHVEAQKHLAHLQEKAIKMKEHLGMLRDCLAPDRPELASVLGRLDKSTKMRELALNPEIKSLNFDSVATLVQEIDDAANKLDGLADRKSALGL